MHFGFEDRGADDLAAWSSELAKAGVQVIYTAHDLDNPHLVDQTDHHRNLETLAQNAAALVTLTEAAARRLTSMTARPVEVIPHPNLVPLSRIAACRGDDRRTGIYVHAATCRPNLDIELLKALGPQLRCVGGIVVHVRTPLDPRRRDVVAELEHVPGLRLELAPRMDDERLWQRIERSEAILLPYLWGTHSGLLEAARDLGTPVLATSIDTLIEQGAEPVDVGNPVEALIRSRRQPGADPIGRRRQRTMVRRRHLELYERLLDT